MGARYGWILTDAHGPGVLRGRFEYAVDALPVVIVFQPGGHAYGFGFDPWIMKWNLETRATGFLLTSNLAAAVDVTTRELPLGANTFNFTPTARSA